MKPLLLCLDLGNSTLSGAVYQYSATVHATQDWHKQEISHMLYFHFSIANQSDDHLLQNLIKFLNQKNVDLARISACMVASVVQSRQGFFMKLQSKLLHVVIRYVHEEYARGAFSFDNAYKQKKMLGSDRIANIIASLYLYPQDNMIVVDFGSATSLQVIHQPEKKFIGGCIAPGLQTSLSALVECSSLLPTLEIVDLHCQDPCIIAVDTKRSIQNGFTFAFRGMISEILLQVKKAGKRNYQCIATGGNALYVRQNFSDLFSHIDSYFTLRGLYIIYHLLDIAEHN